MFYGNSQEGVNNLKIQIRDKEFLHKLNRYGLLGSAHISNLCFSGIAESTMFRRLRKLEDEGHIVRVAGLRRGKCAWYLGRGGAQVIGVEAPSRFTNRNALEHELAITDFRLVLESQGLAQNYVTEREIRKNFTWQRGHERADQVIPDGVLIENVRGKLSAISIEMELNQKSQQRYRRIFHDYLYMKTTGFVWYITKDDAIARAVLNSWRKVERFDSSPRLLLTRLTDLLGNKSSAAIEFEDGSKLSLKELLIGQSEAAQSVSKLPAENASPP